MMKWPFRKPDAAAEAQAGPSGSSVVVEASADPVVWTALQTNALPPAGLDVSVPLGTNQHQFFRAWLAPKRVPEPEWSAQ